MTSRPIKQYTHFIAERISARQYKSGSILGIYVYTYVRTYVRSSAQARIARTGGGKTEFHTRTTCHIGYVIHNLYAHINCVLHTPREVVAACALLLAPPFSSPAFNYTCARAPKAAGVAQASAEIQAAAQPSL